MSEVDVSNAGFKLVQDTVYNTTKIFEGLVSAGILPQGFQVIVGTVTFSASAAGNYAVVDASGNQIVLTAGQQIAFFSAAPTVALAGGTSVSAGLAATATGAVASSFSGVVALADINLGKMIQAATFVVGANQYLNVTTLGTFSSGALSVVLVVV
jgi:hypothetical protein